MTVYIEEDMQKHILDMEVGDRVVTKPRVISRTDVEQFAILTGDPAPPFISEKHAQESGLPKQLSPGLLGVSLAVGLMWQSGFIADALYMGTDRMKLIAPLFANDSIRVEAEVLAKRQTGKGNWVCTYRWTVKNQNGEAVIEGENT